MIKKNKFTFVDLFAGIGGFRFALERKGGICVGYSEIDKNAIKVYEDNFITINETHIGDITKYKGNISSDIVVGGVPCQSWSSAGLKRGFDDARGKLWLDTIDFVKTSKPKAFLFENVKGLADPRNKESLNFIISKFEHLGYVVHHKLVNSFEYGIPQNRERIFLVGLRKDVNFNNFFWPSNVKSIQNLNSFLGLSSTKDNRIKMPMKSRGHHLALDSNKGNYYTLSDIRDGVTCIHSWDIVNTTERQKHICLTLLKNRRKKIYGIKDGNPLSYFQLKKLIPDLKKKELLDLVSINILKVVNNSFDFYNSKNSSGIDGVYRLFLPSSIVYPTITKTGSKDYIIVNPPKIITKKYIINTVLKKKKYRQLTVQEASLLQSFPKSIKFNVSDDVAFGLLGNAVPVKVVEKIIDSILKCI